MEGKDEAGWCSTAMEGAGVFWVMQSSPVLSLSLSDVVEEEQEVVEEVMQEEECGEVSEEQAGGSGKVEGGNM